MMVLKMLQVLNDDFDVVLDDKAVTTVGHLQKLMVAAMVRARDNQDQNRKCEQCGILPDEPNRCSRCKSVVYCSRECQTQHWRSHKKKCSPPSESDDLGMWSLMRQQPPVPEHGLAVKYSHSSDKVDANLLIVIHGNGDNEVNFVRFAEKLQLPLSAILGVRGPRPFGMQGQMWYLEPDGYRPSPEDRLRIAPLWEAAELVAAQIRSAEKAGWLPHRILLLGHGQGGVVAVAAARSVGHTIGGVVASGDAVLEESILSDPVPTRVVKHEQDFELGGSLDFLDLRVQFVASAYLVEENDEKKRRWRYEMVATEKAATAVSQDVVKQFAVTFLESEMGNSRARPQMANFFDDKYTVRFSNFAEKACRVSIEATVISMEGVGSKSDTPLLVTSGELDTRISPKFAVQQLEYVRRKFRIVEARRYKRRKDVLGTDPDELADINGFLLLCSVNKPRLEPKVIHRLDAHPEKLQVVSRKVRK